MSRTIDPLLNSQQVIDLVIYFVTSCGYEFYRAAWAKETQLCDIAQRNRLLEGVSLNLQELQEGIVNRSKLATTINLEISTWAIDRKIDISRPMFLYMAVSRFLFFHEIYCCLNVHGRGSWVFTVMIFGPDWCVPP